MAFSLFCRLSGVFTSPVERSGFGGGAVCLLFGESILEVLVSGYGLCDGFLQCLEPLLQLTPGGQGSLGRGLAARVDG